MTHYTDYGHSDDSLDNNTAFWFFVVFLPVLIFFVCIASYLWYPYSYRREYYAIGNSRFRFCVVSENKMTRARMQPKLRRRCRCRSSRYHQCSSRNRSTLHQRVFDSIKEFLKMGFYK